MIIARIKEDHLESMRLKNWKQDTRNIFKLRTMDRMLSEVKIQTESIKETDQFVRVSVKFLQTENKA